MSHSLGRLPYKFGKPTIKAYYPVVGDIMLPCPGCGMRCRLTLEGDLLHNPTMRPHPKAKGEREAEKHVYHCPGAKGFIRLR